MITITMHIVDSNKTLIPKLFSWKGIDIKEYGYEISWMKKTLLIHIDLTQPCDIQDITKYISLDDR